jgi:uncharacterized membrane protein YfcA
MTWLSLLALGFMGGALSTVAGLGGGIVLVLSISLWLGDPRTALAVTAPALLLGNLHRLWLFRRHLDRKTALVFVAGAAPGAFLGSLLAITLPHWALAWLLLAVSLVATARGLGLFTWTPSARALAPAGFTAGALAATSGAGILVSPILLAAGLRAEAFVATSAATAISIHLARIAGFGIGGALRPELFLWSALLGLGLCAGNFGGSKVRARIGEKGTDRLTYGVMAITVALAIAGVV